MKLKIKGGPNSDDWKIHIDGKEVKNAVRIKFDVDANEVPMVDIRLFLEDIDIELDELKTTELIIQKEPLARTTARNVWMLVYEDADKKSQVFAGRGAKLAAANAFKYESAEWNCTLLNGVKQNFQGEPR